MLEIRERLSHEGYEELRRAAGEAELHITEALGGTEVIGFVAYSYGSDKTIVYGYNDGGDIMLCDGLVRSVMLKSVMRGINHMIFELPDESGFDNLRKLRFINGESRQCTDLESFMDGCCSCKNKKGKD